MGTDWEEQDNAPEYPSWNWQEGDWQRFLQITDAQIKQFGALYQLYMDDPLRLDKVAERMGWTKESWSAGETEELEASAAEELPYTLHLHPVYTVTRGVFKSLYELCFAFAKLSSDGNLLQMALLGTLHEAETQAILGIESQDMGDMALTVCHFKRSLSQLNHAMLLLARMVDEKIEGAELLSREANKRIFDLREIWLRINSEVRDEIERRNKAGE